MADSAPMTSYAGKKMGNKVQTLLQYFTDPLKQRYGVSTDQPAGSGPGGAAATNMKMSRSTADLVKSGTIKPEGAKAIMSLVGEDKMARDTSDMQDTLRIANATADARKSKGVGKQHQRFKYNMLSRPEDQDQGI